MAAFYGLISLCEELQGVDDFVFTFGAGVLLLLLLLLLPILLLLSTVYFWAKLTT